VLHGLRREDFESTDPGPVIPDFSVETIVEKKFKNQMDRGLRILPLKLVEKIQINERNTVRNKGEIEEKGDEKGVIEELNEKSIIPSSDFSLICEVLFEPLRYVNTTAELIVWCKGRGRWRVTIDLIATDPGPEGSVKLIAAVGSTDTQTFKLNNRFMGKSVFEAYFTSGSNSHFSVVPKSGYLAPFGDDGTLFTVIFSPQAYGTKETYVLL
jgi:hypothetical protein